MQQIGYLPERENIFPAKDLTDKSPGRMGYPGGVFLAGQENTRNRARPLSWKERGTQATARNSRQAAFGHRVIRPFLQLRTFSETIWSKDANGSSYGSSDRWLAIHSQGIELPDFIVSTWNPVIISSRFLPTPAYTYQSRT